MIQLTRKVTSENSLMSNEALKINSHLLNTPELLNILERNVINTFDKNLMKFDHSLKRPKLGSV